MPATPRSAFAAALAAFAALALAAWPDAAYAADALDGAQLNWLWALPFAGILLSIATGPVFYPHVWERHLGKFAAFWSAAVIVPLLVTTDPRIVTTTLAHTALLDYMPFILLLLALFTVAGGIYLEGNLRGGVVTNTALLAIGTAAASLVGTTGAAMILIRPLIRANDDRKFNAHVFVFFIFLVCNIGGSLTPLGDPPLFLGFLRGVDFFWTTKHLWAETLAVSVAVLAVFVVIDIYFYRREDRTPRRADPTPDTPLKLHGAVNFALIAVVIGAILMSAQWRPGIEFTVAGVHLELQDLVRDAIFVLVAVASLVLTRKEDRAANGFTWGPIKEVTILFAGIFICIVPVMAMLQAGSEGAFRSVLSLVTRGDGTPNPAAYFWLAGGLSSFLDNAPTYLVFFQLAGGDAARLMTELAPVLAAISLGAVFMGAMTYIGNAPNFMVYAIATERGVRMPSFFGYMLWSITVLLPVFVVLSLVGI